jgi:hypothetical protein
MNNKTTTYLKIHESLHGQSKYVLLDSDLVEIKIAKNKMRYCTYDNRTFIQQSTQHDDYYSLLAKKLNPQGKFVTRIMKPGKKWGVIIGSKLFDND